MPQEIETNWFVISGPPEYGTRILGRRLARELGTTPVLPDAHEIIDGYNVKTVSDLHLNVPYRREITAFEDQLKRENGFIIPYRSTVVFIGGMGDYMASLELAPKTQRQKRVEDQQLEDAASEHALTVRYRRVFIVPRVIEGLVIPQSTSGSSAAGVYKKQVEFYGALGYKPTEIEVASLDRAAKFVLNQLAPYLSTR